MDRFIHRENIAHYRKLLAEPNVKADQVRHRELFRLLADELAKDAVLPLPENESAMMARRYFRVSMFLLATAVLFWQLYVGAAFIWFWFERA